MVEIVLLSSFAILCLSLWYMLWVWRVRVVTADRLSDRVLVLDMADDRTPSVSPLIGRYQLVPWLVAIIAMLLMMAQNLPGLFAFCFALILLLIGIQVEQGIAARRYEKVEGQLANTVDLMVGALNAGATLTGALESAAREVKKPLRGALEDIVSRIQYGDDPQTVLRVFYERLPTENNRLFVTTLSVHWEVGGSLSSVLAAVGGSIRDRLEIDRRHRAMTLQTKLSALVIVLVTYSIAWMMWRFVDARFVTFVTSRTGKYLVAAALLLQALGIYLLSRPSRYRF